MCKKYDVKATVFDRKGRILAIAHNDYTKTHPRQKQFAIKAGLQEKEFLHAEMLCIIRAMKVGVPDKIKVERYGKFGQPLNSAPCPICKLIIKESGIRFIEHTIG